MTVLTIIDVFNNQKIIKNPQHIPRVGDNVDMGYEPTPKIKKIVWQYPNSSDTSIACLVE